MFSALNIGFQKHRNQRDMGNMVAAGSIAGGVMGLPSGLRAAAYGVLAAGGVSTVFGGLIQSLWWAQRTLTEQQEAAAVGSGSVGPTRGPSAAADALATADGAPATKSIIHGATAAPVRLGSGTHPPINTAHSVAAPLSFAVARTTGAEPVDAVFDAIAPSATVATAACGADTDTHAPLYSGQAAIVAGDGADATTNASGTSGAAAARDGGGWFGWIWGGAARGSGKHPS
jgi:hypothetical protein